jgi:SagB-type dehydrogenase family enzyme
VQASRQSLDWPNQPLPFKIYTSAEVTRIPLPFTFDVTSPPTGVLDQSAVARLTYFSNGVTRVLRGMAFRAAACTGALFHIELYLVAAELADLEAGVYHYGAHDNALRRLRRGDVRRRLIEATGNEPAVAAAPLVMILTSTWWRNAWKYEARAYRHAFWDSGTILANLLAVASGQGIPAHVVVGFADADVNALLDVDPAQEAAIALVAIGAGAPAPPVSPPVAPLQLATRPLSPHTVSYPEITAAHEASSLRSGAAAAAWRAAFQPSPAFQPSLASVASPVSREGEPVEAVILRRGSTRRFSHAPITREQLDTLLTSATSPVSTDAPLNTDLYLILNGVEGLAPGAYVLDRAAHRPVLLLPGDFRDQATYLDLGQSLAGDAAFDAYWLVDLDQLDARGYRAAQLAAAIEAGQLYLAAYRLGLGATGLTFFDDDVIRFFEPHAAGKSVMFLTAAGHPLARARPSAILTSGPVA